MIKKIFNKITGNSPIEKTYKEFKKLKTLEAKRQKFVTEYGENEDLLLQKEVLQNNILTLAHVFQGLKPELLSKNKSEYFNMQGTSVNVLELYDPKENYNHTKTGTNTNVIVLQKYSDLVTDIFTLESKFRNLNSKRMSIRISLKIKTIALKKINNKMIDYCNMFKGNEELVRKFVFRNMNEPDEDYHNELMVYSRINFLGFLVKATNGNILDSGLIEIANKDLIEIPSTILSNNTNIVKFLKNFKTYKFDFIIKRATLGEITD